MTASVTSASEHSVMCHCHCCNFELRCFRVNNSLLCVTGSSNLVIWFVFLAGIGQKLSGTHVAVLTKSVKQHCERVPSATMRRTVVAMMAFARIPFIVEDVHKAPTRQWVTGKLSSEQPL